jgi:hypothetical protein
MFEKFQIHIIQPEYERLRLPSQPFPGGAWEGGEGSTYTILASLFIDQINGFIIQIPYF